MWTQLGLAVLIGVACGLTGPSMSRAVDRLDDFRWRRRHRHDPAVRFFVPGL